MVQARQWVSLSYEEDRDEVVVRVHALHPFGTRHATVVREVEMTPELETAIQGVLAEHQQDITEWAEEAAVTHRMIARNRGENHNAPLAYSEGTGMTGEVVGEVIRSADAG